MVGGGHRETSLPPACCLLMAVLLLCVAGSLATILQTGPAERGDCQEARAADEGSERDSSASAVGDVSAHDCKIAWPAMFGYVPGRSNKWGDPGGTLCGVGWRCAASGPQNTGMRSRRCQQPGCGEQSSVLPAIGNATRQTGSQEVMDFYRVDRDRVCWLKVREVCQPLHMGLPLPAEEFEMAGNVSGGMGRDAATGPQPGGLGDGVTDALDNLSVQKFWQRQEQKKSHNVTGEGDVGGGQNDTDAKNEAHIEGKLDHDEVGELVNFVAAVNGGKVVQANAEMSKPQKAIDGSSDSFLKTDSGVESWLILELSQVARVQLMDLTMKEMYSSRVAEFEVFGRDSHPGKDLGDYPAVLRSAAWQYLGRFDAENRKGNQQFRINNPTWVRYLGIHFLSYHGTESVCAINEVKVFGVSAAQDIEAELMKMASDSSATSVETDLPSANGKNSSVIASVHQSGDGNGDSRVENAAAPHQEFTEGIEKDPSHGGSVQAPSGSTVHPDIPRKRERVNGTQDPGVPGTTAVAEQTIEAAPSAISTESNPPGDSAVPQIHSPVNINKSSGGDLGNDHSEVKPTGNPSTKDLRVRPGNGMSLQTQQPARTSQQPAVRAYEKIRQDIESLQFNSSMLWTYVDQLQSGLKRTISEMDKDLGLLIQRHEVLNSTLLFYLAEMDEGLQKVTDFVSANVRTADEGTAEVNSTMKHLEQRMSQLERELRANQQQSKLLMGLLNMAGSFGGLFALKSRFFGANAASRALFAASVSALNMLVGILNITAGVSLAADWAVQMCGIRLGGALSGLWGASGAIRP